MQYCDTFRENDFCLLILLQLQIQEHAVESVSRFLTFKTMTRTMLSSRYSGFLLFEGITHEQKLLESFAFS